MLLWLRFSSLVKLKRSVYLLKRVQVIPQLIARIDTPRQLVGRLISQLLMDIGKAHPQALVYPLTVAAKSNTPARRTAASKVLKSMCEHSDALVQQSLLVNYSAVFYYVPRL